MPEHFLFLDPLTGDVKASRVCTSGYVESLAACQAANPGDHVLKIPYTPTVHDNRTLHLHRIKPGTRTLQKYKPDPVLDKGKPLKDTPPDGSPLDLGFVDETEGVLDTDGKRLKKEA